MRDIHLILQYYIPKKIIPKRLRHQVDPVRKQDVDTCLQNNLNNPLITQVHLLTEENLNFDHFDNSEKIIQKCIGKWLTHQEALRYATTLKENTLCVLANIDIYYDESLALVIPLSMEGKMFALLRWEDLPDGTKKILHPKRFDMQDTWIFETPVPHLTGDTKLGVRGGENRFAHDCASAGLLLYNPCFEIKSYHLHTTEHRKQEYYKRIARPYFDVHPGWLKDIPDL